MHIVVAGKFLDRRGKSLGRILKLACVGLTDSQGDERDTIVVLDLDRLAECHLRLLMFTKFIQCGAFLNQ